LLRTLPKPILCEYRDYRSISGLSILHGRLKSFSLHGLTLSSRQYVLKHKRGVAIRHYFEPIFRAIDCWQTQEGGLGVRRVIRAMKGMLGRLGLATGSFALLILWDIVRRIGVVINLIGFTIFGGIAYYYGSAKWREHVLAEQVVALPPCIVDERLLFERAVERIWKEAAVPKRRIGNVQSFHGLVPDEMLEKFLVSHGTPKVFIEKNPDCCSLATEAWLSFEEALEGDWSGKPYYNTYPISKETTVVVSVKVRARLAAEGHASWFNKEYEVLLGKCGERLNIYRFDLSDGMTHKELEEKK